MRLRVVAIPLIAGMCLGTPAFAGSITDDQQVRGRGARDRNGDNGGGQNRGRDDGNGSQRTADRRGDNGAGQRTATRGDRDGEQQRAAVQRDGDRDRDRNGGNGRRDNGPVIVTRSRPNVNINIGSSYRGPRYYAPAHYDRWARQYYRWSPIGYAPWSLIYGSIGFSNFGYYGAIGSPNPYYGTYGYGYGGAPYPAWQASGYDIGGIRLKIRPRDAQVFVDGYYAGLVDDFDGTFQSLRLEQGGHKLEIHMPGFEDLELDVHVQPGRTITLSEQLRPRP